MCRDPERYRDPARVEDSGWKSHKRYEDRILVGKTRQGKDFRLLVKAGDTGVGLFVPSLSGTIGDVEVYWQGECRENKSTAKKVASQKATHFIYVVRL